MVDRPVPALLSPIETVRAFFGPRAATWEQRFPDDGPRFAAAVGELELRPGDAVLDAACGTGRALPPLRECVGPAGAVIGMDVTAAMLAEARRLGRGAAGALVLADVLRLPLADASLDAVFAAGLISHVADPVACLAEFGRACRPGARLGLFHPIGRVALAARHGHEPALDDIRAEPRMRRALTLAGWHVERIDDADDRYLVLATR